MESSKQHLEDSLSNAPANGKITVAVQRQPSVAVTAATLSTTGSDSSIAISDEEESEHRAVEETANAEVDVYFSDEYVQKVNEAARRENDKLRLNLGLPIDPSAMARRQPIKLLIRLVHRFLLLIESPLFKIWSQYIPLRFRQKLTLLAWKIYFPVHKLLIGRRTGLHKDASLEYHALSTVMWWGRLVSIFIEMRTLESLLTCSHFHLI
jgi:hypothetical protein